MKSLRVFLICSLAVLAGQGCLGFGGSSSNVADGGVWRSANGGTDWVSASVVPGVKDVGSIAGQDVNVLVFDPEDAETMYAGTLANGLLQSVNGGGTWTRPREPALLEGKIQDIAVDPTDVCTVYVAKGTRLYKTDDCLRTFDGELYVEARANTFIRSIAVDWFNTDVVYIGLTNGDLLKSEDGGDTWRTILSVRAEITDILVSNGDSRRVLIGTSKAGFYRSEDSGASWKDTAEALKPLKSASVVNAIDQDATGGAIVAATGFGLIRSYDGGVSWNAIDLVTNPGQVEIRDIALNPKNPDQIYYAAAGTFYRTDDGGKTWQTHRSPSTRLVQTIAVHPETPEVVYIGVVAPPKKGL